MNAPVPPSFETVVDVLRRRAAADDPTPCYTFLSNDEQGEERLTAAALDRKARAIAAGLQARTKPGDRVVLLYPPGLAYIEAFFGCLYAGVIAVPAYPPTNGKQGRATARVAGIFHDAAPSLSITTRSILARRSDLSALDPVLSAADWMTSEELIDPLDWREPDIGGGTVAFLQYTSGSTSSPKGVMVTHANLLANQRMIQAQCGHTEASHFVGWLPLYHDMGLIGNVLQPLYVGSRCVLMAPTTFLQNPYRWLQAISEHRGYTSGGPNFAYDLCVRKITDEQRASLDLRCWRVAFNGAEPIHAETFERFARAFEPCGFRRDAFFPCYGLAEATLIVSGGMPDAGETTCAVDSRALEIGATRLPASADAPVRLLVSCGPPVAETEVTIVHPETRRGCAPGATGEIWVHGPAVAAGYWGRAAESKRTFRARILGDRSKRAHLRTGDLGFMHDGQLFVTGRLKDLVIIRGRNHHPEDIERTASECGGELRPGGAAAFSITVGAEERLILVLEVDRGRQIDADQLGGRIRQHIAAYHDVLVHAVVLVKAGSVPKTSSGKVQRHACRAAYLDGSLAIVAQSILDDTPETAAPPAPGVRELIEATAGERQQRIEGYLIALIAAATQVDRRSLRASDAVNQAGLDSVMGLELIHRIQTDLGVQLPHTSFLRDATIQRVAEEVATLLVDAARSAPGERGTGALVPTYPLSPGQHALRLTQLLAPESGAYTISRAFALPAAVDAFALAEALRVVIDRHPVLRCRIAEADGVAVQQVLPARDIHPVLDVRDVSALDDVRVRALVSDEAARPFDLTRAPLIRATIFERRAPAVRVLLLSIHHIAADYWSLSIVLRELGIAYAAAAGDQARMPAFETPALYWEYVAHQTGLLESPEGDRLWRFWEQQLLGELLPLSLPTDRPRPPLQTFSGAAHRFTLQRATWARVKTFSRDKGATPFMTLLSVFHLLLHRYTGQTGILVGSPSAGRSRAAWAGAVGYFTNPLVLRCDFTADPSFSDLLAQVRRTVIEAFEHEDLPFPWLVERLQQVRDPSRSPLFQAMFVFFSAGLSNSGRFPALALGEAGVPVTLGGSLTIESIALETHTAQFDLTLVMGDVGESLSASLEYNTDLFDAATIARMARHYQTLLDSVMREPDGAVSAASLIAADEARRIEHDWNATGDPSCLPDTPIHELIQQRAADAPDRVAVVSGSQTITCGELDERAWQVAHTLQDLGIGAESLVGVCLHRSVELVTAFLGVLKTGAAYVPVEPGAPAAWIETLFVDAGVRCVLTERAFADRFRAAGVPVLVLDEPHPHSPRSRIGTRAAIHPDSLMYVIYTSGSTGAPKGAMNTHQGVLNRILWMRRHYAIGADDTVLQKTPIGFDVSVWEFYLPLVCGARVVMARPDGHRDPGYLAHVIQRESIAVVHFVPSMLAAFLDEPAVGARCASVRRVFCSGEALSPGLRDRCLDTLDAELHNLYGPTEAAVDVSYWACSRTARAPVVPIGRPIANIQLYILDRHDRIIPPGIAGELCIAGVGLARGYLARPDLTAEKFVPNPFGHDGQRMYRTGDLARWLPDGQIDFIGRRDHQVKIRGCRVEPGAVEAALSSCRGVQDAAVVVREGRGAAETRLAGYVVLQSSAIAMPGDIRAELRTKLPDYMVPATIAIVGALPWTASGKVNRAALQRESATSTPPTDYVPPRTDNERILSDIWADVLSVDRVGIEDNFFDLGGHSLLATQITARVRRAIGRSLDLRDVFEAPTVMDLARRLDVSGRGAGGESPVPIDRVPRGAPLPLSFAQQRLWFLDQLEGQTAAYNMPVTATLEGRLEVATLTRALSEIARRHEVLRTRLASRGGEPTQIIDPPRRFDLAMIDLSDWTTPACDDWIARTTACEAQRPFDLSAGPLWRGLLLRRGPERHTLLLTMHHVVSDGWSLGVFVRELGSLYDAEVQRQPSPLRPLVVQYADYAVWQRDDAHATVFEAQLGYWQQQLHGLSTLNLPADRARPSQPPTGGAREPISLDRETTRKLADECRREGATVFMGIVVALQVLLHRYTGDHDIAVGTDVAGRTERELEPLIGFFVNQLVLRTDLSGNPTFREVLHRVREVSLGAYAHQRIPFEQVVDALGPERTGHAPLFQVKVVLQNAPMPELRLSGLRVKTSGTYTRTAKFDLLLDLREVDGGIDGAIEYRTDLFEASTIRRMGRHFTTVCAAVAGRLDERIGDAAVLPIEERRQLLLASSGDRVASDTPAVGVHELFEQQVVERPDTVAVTAGDGQVTYQALNRRANRFARYLMALGVGAEVRVALHLEPGADMIVAVLGTLKAGAAYLPLDPAYPSTRLQLMLDDARVPLLITQHRLAGSCPVHWGQIVEIDGDWECHAPDEEGNLATVIDSASAAYVIYTSGSTGQPKGVVLTHHGACNLAGAQKRAFGVAAGDAVLQFASFSFDAATWEWMLALLSGGTLVLAARDRLLPGPLLVETLSRHDVSLVTLPPSALAAMPQGPLPALATMVVAGEACPPDLVERWAPGRRFVNAYGPTETTVCASMSRPLRQHGSIDIGRPIANVQTYVLDAYGEPVPPGVDGELCIGGDSTARGYLNRADLTAASFIPDPFSAAPGARVYRTGDRVRWLADGVLQFIGRRDAQVKVRGYRVELGEIESALFDGGSLEQCAVIVRPDRYGASTLAAFVVPRHPALNVEELRAHVRTRLPEVHGAVDHQGARESAGDAERQGRSASVGGDGARRPRGGIRRPAYGDRRNARRCVARCAGDRSRWRRRQLLRGGRALAGGHAGGRAAARHFRRRRAVARAVRGADRARAGRIRRSRARARLHVDGAAADRGPTARAAAAVVRAAASVVPRSARTRTGHLQRTGGVSRDGRARRACVGRESPRDRSAARDLAHDLSSRRRRAGPAHRRGVAGAVTGGRFEWPRP